MFGVVGYSGVRWSSACLFTNGVNNKLKRNAHNSAGANYLTRENDVSNHLCNYNDY